MLRVSSFFIDLSVLNCQPASVLIRRPDFVCVTSVSLSPPSGFHLSDLVKGLTFLGVMRQSRSSRRFRGAHASSRVPTGASPVGKGAQCCHQPVLRSSALLLSARAPTSARGTRALPFLVAGCFSCPCSNRLTRQPDPPIRKEPGNSHPWPAPAPRHRTFRRPRLRRIRRNSRAPVGRAPGVAHAPSV